MDDYKLFIANLMCGCIGNLENQSDEVIFSHLSSCLNDLNLDMNEWGQFIFESLQGNKSHMSIQQALSLYGYDKAGKINSNPTFAQVWVEIIEFLDYFNLGLKENILIDLEELVSKLTKYSIKKEYSWDKRVVARLIVKKGYENALKISNNPNEDLVKQETFKILGRMYGFENSGLLFAVRDLLKDKFYDERLLGEAISKIAIEDIMKMGNPDENIDFEMWIGRKVKLIQDFECLGDEGITKEIQRTNYKELFLEYLSCFYDVDDAIEKEFIIDVGNRSYGRLVDRQFILRIIFSMASFEATDELRGDLDFERHQILRNQKIHELLEYFGWQDDYEVLEEIKKIERYHSQKALDDLMNNSMFKF